MAIYPRFTRETIATTDGGVLYIDTPACTPRAAVHASLYQINHKGGCQKGWESLLFVSFKCVGDADADTPRLDIISAFVAVQEQVRGLYEANFHRSLLYQPLLWEAEFDFTKR